MLCIRGRILEHYQIVPYALINPWPQSAPQGERLFRALESVLLELISANEEEYMLNITDSFLTMPSIVTLQLVELPPRHGFAVGSRLYYARPARCITDEAIGKSVLDLVVAFGEPRILALDLVRVVTPMMILPRFGAKPVCRLPMEMRLKTPAYCNAVTLECRHVRLHECVLPLQLKLIYVIMDEYCKACEQLRVSG